MLNKVMLIGNIGGDPKVRYLDSGVAVASFSLATNETYKSKSGEKTTQTEWHNIILWRGLAETAEKYLKKGDKIFVEGRLRHRSYDDKEGVKRYITEVYGDSMVMLGAQGGQGTNDRPDNSSDNPPTQSPDVPDATDDGLPF